MADCTRAYRLVSTAVPLAALLLFVGPASAIPLTLSQSQILAMSEVTTAFGGNGRVLSRSIDGDGVLFEIEGGTIDFGKVALQRLLYGRDLTAFDGFGLHFDVVSAPDPIEVNPFIRTAASGTIFNQDVPGVMAQGDSFDGLIPFAGIEQLDYVYSLGFQYFTAGDIEEPAAQTVLLRVSPLSGGYVPEPATALLIGLGLAVLGISPRRRSHDGGSSCRTTSSHRTGRSPATGNRMFPPRRGSGTDRLERSSRRFRSRAAIFPIRTLRPR